MQYNDQKTAGIPGLLPLYVGMPARVNEKVAKGATVTILKHAPCTVVGWDLHPDDRVRDNGGERLLQRLPNCIYLKFPDATWRVHEGLDPGVFPLKPARREWTLNDSTKAKVNRHGYALVPDFACTGFMIQGATVEAELAECGDVLAAGDRVDVFGRVSIGVAVRVVGRREVGGPLLGSHSQ